MKRPSLSLFFIFYFAVVTNLAASRRSDSCSIFVKVGVGIGSIVVGKSTANDVVTLHEGNYELIEHQGYFNEIKLKKVRISFYYRRDDSEKKIISITAINSPCIVSIPKGGLKETIIVGVSTLQDVIGVYGKAEPFTTSVTSANKTWFYEYDGVRFHVLFKSWNEADRKDFLKKEIYMIEIIKSRRG